MGDNDKDRRSSRRNEVSLEAIVKGRESEADFWKENTEIVTVSRLGASFNLSRECGVGRIVSLIVKMPKELRCYDHDKNLYRVWGLVQHCSPLNEDSEHEIGIAFIGKFAPEGYLKDPLKTYRIVGMDEDGFWNVGETKAPFVSRAHYRFPSALPVRVAALDEDNEEAQVDTDAVTENISEGGASIFSRLEVETGDAVKFKCEENGFQSLAVVRNRQMRENDKTTIHLEFSRLFPIKDVDLAFEDGKDLKPADDPDGDAADLSEDIESPQETDLAAGDDLTVEEVSGEQAPEEPTDQEDEGSSGEDDDTVERDDSLAPEPDDSEDIGSTESIDVEAKEEESDQGEDDYGDITISEAEPPAGEEYPEAGSQETESENKDAGSETEDESNSGSDQFEDDTETRSE